jgi:hypothetical protein
MKSTLNPKPYNITRSMTLQRSEVLVKRLNQPFAERQVLDVQQLDLQYE